MKPCKEGAAQAPSGGRGGGAAQSSRLHLPCSTVKNLILQAYYAYADGKVHPPPFPPIEGGPGWIETERYTIDAAADATATHALMNGPMLQLLLEDRFQLKLHREARKSAAYALTVAKDGPKLTPSLPGDCVDIGLVKPLAGPPPPRNPGERLTICGASRPRKAASTLTVMDVPGTTLDYFCKTFLAIAFWDHPVVNKTGLEGLYNIQLEFAPDESTPGPPDTPRPAAADPAEVPGPSIFTALQQQLGLKLEATRAPREFLVIDSIQRASEN